MTKNKKYNVLIPDELYQIVEFEQDGLPGVAVVNNALVDFEPKIVFGHHCSLMIQCKKLIENGMPTREEVKVLDEFGDFLDDEIKGVKNYKPNALFLARITWNETRELIWRIYDPEITNDFLTNLINKKEYPREFDYRIDDDAEWKLAEWHLEKRD